MGVGRVDQGSKHQARLCLAPSSVLSRAFLVCVLLFKRNHLGRYRMPKSARAGLVWALPKKPIWNTSMLTPRGKACSSRL